MPRTPSSPPTGTLTLYTIAMSHYSEKIRWLMDIEGLPYREVALTPVFHVLPALRMGGRGRTTVPVLRSGEHTVQDSTHIIQWLSTRPGGLRTLPNAQRAEIMALEDEFDALGNSVVRYLYQQGFAHTEFILALWTRFATPAQAGFLRVAYPVIRAVFKVKLRINEASAQRSARHLDAALTKLEARLADGRRYLVGDQLTVADLTAAALLAPLACPPEHGVYGQPEFIEKMASSGPDWRSRPGLQWVRRLYAEHRGPFWAQTPTPH